MVATAALQLTPLRRHSHLVPPQAFVDMMSGKNKGKAVVQCLDKDPITGQ